MAKNVRRVVALELITTGETNPLRSILTFDDLPEVTFLDRILGETLIEEPYTKEQLRELLTPAVDVLNLTMLLYNRTYRLGYFTSDEFIESSGRPPLWKESAGKTYSFKLMWTTLGSQQYTHLRKIYSAPIEKTLEVGVWLSVEVL